MCACENKKEGTAEVLKEWLANKNWDFRERKGGDWVWEWDEEDEFHGALNCLENTVQKQQHVKQSIDHALNLLKAYCPAPAAEPASPLGEYTFYPPSASRPDINANHELSSRRPTLPHIYDDLPIPSPSNFHRPRSAGQDAEPEPLRVPSDPSKLGSNYSLLGGKRQINL